MRVPEQAERWRKALRTERHSDVPYLLSLADGFFHGETPERQFASTAEMIGYVQKKLLERKESLGDDLLSAVLKGKVEGGRPLTENEIIGMASFARNVRRARAPGRTSSGNGFDRRNRLATVVRWHQLLTQPHQQSRRQSRPANRRPDNDERLRRDCHV